MGDTVEPTETPDDTKETFLDRTHSGPEFGEKSTVCLAKIPELAALSGRLSGYAFRLLCRIDSSERREWSSQSSQIESEEVNLEREDSR